MELLPAHQPELHPATLPQLTPQRQQQQQEQQQQLLQRQQQKQQQRLVNPDAAAVSTVLKCNPKTGKCFTIAVPSSASSPVHQGRRQTLEGDGLTTTSASLRFVVDECVPDYDRVPCPLYPHPFAMSQREESNRGKAVHEASQEGAASSSLALESLWASWQNAWEAPSATHASTLASQVTLFFFFLSYPFECDFLCFLVFF